MLILDIDFLMPCSKDSDASQSGVNPGGKRNGEGRISSVVFTSGVDLNANSSSIATVTTVVEESTDGDNRGSRLCLV